jgi:hypothetical protein
VGPVDGQDQQPAAPEPADDTGPDATARLTSRETSAWDDVLYRVAQARVQAAHLSGTAEEPPLRRPVEPRAMEPEAEQTAEGAPEGGAPREASAAVPVRPPRAEPDPPPQPAPRRLATVLSILLALVIIGLASWRLTAGGGDSAEPASRAPVQTHAPASATPVSALDAAARRLADWLRTDVDAAARVVL